MRAVQHNNGTINILTIESLPRNAAVVDVPTGTVVISDHGSDEANERAARAAFDASLSLVIPPAQP